MDDGNTIDIGLAVVPFGYDAALEVHVCTAAVEVVVVLSVWILLSSAGRRAVLLGSRR